MRRANGGEMPEPESARHLAAADVEVVEVTWIWPGFIPQGKIVLLEGDPDLAKTTISLDLAARITAGRPMPDGSPGIAGEVVFLGFEDDFADTLVPRFRAAGGDDSKLTLLVDVMGPEGPRPYSIPEDALLIEEVVRAKGAVLLIIDPLMAALSGEVKSGVDHHVRRALAPLKALAERCGCTVLVIRHWNKNVAVQNLLYRGGGSIGIIGASRAALAVTPDPEDATRRVLIPVKANLAAQEERSAMRYRVVSCGVPGTDIETAGIEWLGRADASKLATSLAQAGAPIDTSAVGEAVGILKELLANGPVLATIAKRYMGEAGVSKSTVDRAKKKLHVKARPVVNEHGDTHWWWSLPTAEHQGRTSTMES
jgi:hypothetical protein